MKSNINCFYDRHDCARICQGDILKDVKFYSFSEEKESIFQYIIILSQDCDLEWSRTSKIYADNKSFYDQFLPSILFAPAFMFDEISEGVHLKELFGIEQKGLTSGQIKKIKKNNSELRYHYLPFYQEYGCQEIIIDFKIYYTLPLDYLSKIHKVSYVATINELFREHLSQRFSHYLSRIGLPVVKELLDNEPISIT